MCAKVHQYILSRYIVSFDVAEFEQYFINVYTVYILNCISNAIPETKHQETDAFGRK